MKGMKEGLVYLDGFSGYGGFHMGLEQGGFEFSQTYFSEKDKYAIANYQYNFPNSIYAGTIENVSRRTIPHIDVFSFGWPCQSNSMLGKREGQRTDTQSGLLFEAIRIIDEFRPECFFAENVKGLLSVNEGTDIIESLKLFTHLNDSLPQYNIEMQLFNTLKFLPQNRERLFFIGHLRGSGSRRILPIGQDDKLLTVGNARSKEILDAAQTLTKRQYANWTGNFVVDGTGRIRRLTPVECERLQGLPDNWTKYGVFNGAVKIIPDNKRYEMTGNGVSIPVVKSIATHYLNQNI